MRIVVIFENLYFTR